MKSYFYNFLKYHRQAPPNKTFTLRFLTNFILPSGSLYKQLKENEEVRFAITSRLDFNPVGCLEATSREQTFPGSV